MLPFLMISAVLPAWPPPRNVAIQRADRGEFRASASDSARGLRSYAEAYGDRHDANRSQETRMAVRDLVDVEGVRWSVWPVVPEALQPKTAAEDYLGEYESGWLCFESASERRRLPEYPDD